METNTEEKETATLQVVANDALSLITKAEIDIQISTAKAFPRSLRDVSGYSEYAGWDPFPVNLDLGIHLQYKTGSVSGKYRDFLS